MQRLTSFRTPAIIDAIERTLIAHTIACVQAAGGHVHEESEITWVETAIPLTAFNGVIRTALTGAEMDQLITATLVPFRMRQQPMAWWVTPSTQPHDLSRRLTPHGFVPEGADVGMAAEVLALDLPAAPDGMTVVRVHDAATMETWIQTFGHGFGVSSDVLIPYREMMTSAHPDRHPAGQYYLAHLDGEPVGTAGLFCSAGVSNVVQVCNVPTARRRGVGAAATRAALRDACAMGYRIAVLRASEAGTPLYRALGFSDCCTLDSYRWPAPFHRS
jgi:GNAT superfamily N-acetyltransferase